MGELIYAAVVFGAIFTISLFETSITNFLVNLDSKDNSND